MSHENKLIDRALTLSPWAREILDGVLDLHPGADRLALIVALELAQLHERTQRDRLPRGCRDREDQEGEMSNHRWGYSTEEQPDMWMGSYPTRQDAINAAIADEPDPAVALWVSRGVQPDPVGYLDVDDIIERAQESAYDEAGEAAEDWLAVTEEAKAELESLLREWVQKHAPIEFWVSGGKAELVRSSK